MEKSRGRFRHHISVITQDDLKNEADEVVDFRRVFPDNNQGKPEIFSQFSRLILQV